MPISTRSSLAPMSGLVVLAGLASVLLVNCSHPDDPVSPNPAVASPEAPAEHPQFTALEPRQATESEVERMLAERKSKGLPELASAPPSAPLAKSAALSPCMVNFNSSVGLSFMPNHAKSTFATEPYYFHYCNGGGYVVRTWSINLDHFHLVPEDPNYCFGTGLNLGTKSNGQCINQRDAKYWPRFATNMNSNTGVGFMVTYGYSLRYFDLKSVFVKSGSLELWVFKPGSGWFYWTGLGPGTWTFPIAPTGLSEINIYHSGKNGTVAFDNLEIAIIP